MSLSLSPNRLHAAVGHAGSASYVDLLSRSVVRAYSYPQAGPVDLKRNQFGGAVGGPLKKDKLWFYANYEGLPEITAFTAGAYTATPAMFGGDFREVPEQIFDPATFSQATGRRLPFANQTIPDSRTNGVFEAIAGILQAGGPREAMRLQFRAEMFNVWNYAQFGNPVGNTGSPNYGLVSSARQPRCFENPGVIF